MSNFEEIQSTLTMKEWNIIEQKSGMAVTTLGDINEPKSGLLIALAYVWSKRSNPNFTYEEAENLTMGEVNELLGLNDSPKDEEPETK